MACMEWQRSRTQFGHGKFKRGGKTVLAHRDAYCKARGIPLSAINGKVVRHTCDNPACINPAHLVLGTQADNIADRDVHSRTSQGEHRYNAGITDEQAEYIRRVYQPRHPEYGGAVLARRFGVSANIINRVASGKTYTGRTIK